MAAPISQLEGKYEILEKIKEGGMGAVYKVRHRLLDEIRVVKLIRPQLESDENIRARFLGEARKGVRLRHRHIAQFYDFSIDEAGNAFIVMEFVEGITLEDMLRKVGPASIGLTLEMADQSLQALGYLHKRGIVHRDISPDNLMVGLDEDGNPLIRLIDLGIAKVLTGESGLTQAGTFLGKVRYASPEQFRGQEGVGVDFRSDVYSFGIVLYELLTGMHPIRGSNLSSFIAGHLFNPPLDFATSDPQGRVPSEIRDSVLRALEKLPERRFESATAFAQELARARARLPAPPDEVASILSACHVHTARPVGGRLSTTQERLNREFGLSETPSRGGPLETPPPAQAPRTVPIIPFPDQGTAGQSEPTTSDHGVSQGAEPRAARPSTALPAQLASIEAALGAGDFDTAARALDSAYARIGAAPELDALRAKLADARARQRRSALETLLVEAREHIARGKFPAALDALRKAGAIEPENAVAADLEAQIRASQRAYEEEKRRQAALAKEVRRLDGFLNKGDLDAAAGGLESAIASLGAAEEFEVLRARLAEARARERRAAVEALIRQSQEQRAKALFKQALATLEKAGEMEPGNAAIAKLEKEAREAKRADDEEKHRQESIAGEVLRIERLLNRKELDAASRALGAAVATLGPLPEFDALRARLDEATARERNAAIKALLADAKAHLANAEFLQALAALRKAGEIDPKSADVATLETQVRDSQRAFEEEKRRQEAIAKEARRLDGFLKKGDLEAASRSLDAAAAALGSVPELETFRVRLADARARERRESLEALAAEAKEHLERARFAQALAAVRKAAAIEAGNVAIAELEARILGAQHAQEEAKRRQEAVAKEVRRVEGLLKKGDLDAATRGIDAALGALGAAPELDALRARLAEARARERGKAVDALVVEAKARIKTSDFDGAIECLEKALALVPGDARIQATLAETRESRRRSLAAEARSREVATAVAAVEELAGKGLLAQAVAKLDSEAKRLGDHEAFLALRRQLAVRQQAERDAQAAAVPAAPLPPRPAPRVERPTSAADVTIRLTTQPPIQPRPEPPKPTGAVPPPEVRKRPEPVPTPRPHLPPWAWAAGGVLLVTLVALTAVFTRTAPAPRAVPGVAGTTAHPVAGAQARLVIDALPWGEVVSIVNDGGDKQELPADRFTPLAVSLRPGRYLVTLSNPGFAKAVEVRAEVGADLSGRCLAEFRRATADDFLAHYGW